MVGRGRAPEPTRTLADFKEARKKHPELFETEDPFGGFYTEEELAKRWRKQRSTIRDWRLEYNRKLPPYVNMGTAHKGTPLYPKIYVWKMEMENLNR